VLLALPIKSTPIDINVFHTEMTVKYPTFSAPTVPTVVPNTSVTTAKLAEAYNPIPVRHHYNHDDGEHMMHPGHHNMSFHQGGPQSGFRPIPQPATPAPSPPPSPKPTKKMYQTDQTRPFLFPFSSASSRGLAFGRGARDARDGTLVPFAIAEAERLYNRHMYVSLALWQMWRTREECMTSESGLEVMPGSEGMLDLLRPPPVVVRATVCLAAQPA
jgi:hypothetical protein